MPSNKSFPVFGFVYNIFVIPYLFVIGFVVGLLAPIAAIAGIVAGVRMLTGKVPFLSPVQDESGEQQLVLKLVSEEEVGPLFEEQKEKIGGDLGKMQAEIQAIIEGVQAEAKAAAEEGKAASAEA